MAQASRQCGNDWHIPYLLSHLPHSLFLLPSPHLDYKTHIQNGTWYSSSCSLFHGHFTSVFWGLNNVSRFYFYFVCVGVLPKHVSVHHVCAAPSETRRGRQNPFCFVNCVWTEVLRKKGGRIKVTPGLSDGADGEWRAILMGRVFVQRRE